MSGKSQHSKGKRSSQKKKGGQGSLAAAAQRQAVAQAYKPVSQPEVSASSANVSASRVTPAVARHPYIASELRRIGVLAGIMLAILVVLWKVLPYLL